MKSIKNFLIGFVIVYLTVPFMLASFLGGPNFSSEFNEAHKADLDRYLEITKSTDYKKWVQAPDANQASPQFQERIDFVANFEALEAFQAESSRRARYDTASDLFNSLMLIVLVVALARGPVGNLLDGMVAEERHRVEQVEESRSDAARRKADAERKLESVEVQREESNESIGKRIESDAKDIEAATARALEQLRQEAEDRKRQEELIAQRKLKAALVDEAIAILAERYATSNDAASDAALVDRFLDELGERA